MLAFIAYAARADNPIGFASSHDRFPLDRALLSHYTLAPALFILLQPTSICFPD
jgi:hypothetical protein